MAKNIPEIDDLIKGINDPEITLTDKRQEESDVHETGKAETTAGHTTAPVSLSGGLEKCWEDFLSFLEDTGTHDDKKERLVCKLDRDLADSLDDCDIRGRCRSALVNAIVRAFFGAFLPQLARYRRENKSLFMNLKEI